MFSIYIHIPFCATKCNYCSFQVCPKDLMDDDKWNIFIEQYIQGLKKEIDFYSESLSEQELFTVYFGGGTPSIIGVDRTIDLIEYISNKFNIENLAELSIELNPYPEDEILDFVEQISKQYKKFSRLRFSFGIQSFDNSVLKTTGRESSFPGLVDFLRKLRLLKKDNMVFNFDLIAFGIFNKTKKGELILWNDNVFKFFEDFVFSHFADSFSLYTLELFEGSKDFYNMKDSTQIKTDKLDLGEDREDLIASEFEILQGLVEDAGYSRYEISNFALSGKSSIHNMVYRNMENYIGIGTSACGFLKKDFLNKLDDKGKKILSKFGVDNSDSFEAIRTKNTININEYSNGSSIPEIEIIEQEDLLFEEFFLTIRKGSITENLEKYSSILVNNYKEILEELITQNLIFLQDRTLRLTDEGFMKYNYIITELTK